MKEHCPVKCGACPKVGGWALVGSICDARTLPFLTTNDYSDTPLLQPHTQKPALHRDYATIKGNQVMVGEMVGTGDNVGHVLELNDCDPGDAACWAGGFIDANDGETFGAWVVNGGTWGRMPPGCKEDKCAGAHGDRDHSRDDRIATFGGIATSLPRLLLPRPVNARRCFAACDASHGALFAMCFPVLPPKPLCCQNIVRAAGCRFADTGDALPVCLFR